MATAIVSLLVALFGATRQPDDSSAEKRLADSSQGSIDGLPEGHADPQRPAVKGGKGRPGVGKEGAGRGDGAARLVLGSRRGRSGADAGGDSPDIHLPDSAAGPAVAAESDEPVTVGALIAASRKKESEKNEGIVYDSGYQNWFSTNARLQVPLAAPVTGERGAVSAWVQPMWEPESPPDATFVQLSGGMMEIKKSGDVLSMTFRDPSGQENAVTVDMGGWQQGRWYQVAGTWDLDRFELYVNGKPVGNGRRTGDLQFPEDTRVYVGGDEVEGHPVAPGVISHVQVFERILPQAEVETYYQLGPR